MAPLPKQKSEVIFASGLDKKTDGKLVAKLTTLDNGQFVTANTVSKRSGFTASSQAPDVGAFEATNLFAFKNQFIFKSEATGLQPMTEGFTSGYLGRGGPRMPSVSSEVVMPSSGISPKAMDCEFSSDGAYSCSAFVATNPSSHAFAVVRHEASGQIIYATRLVASSIVSVQVVRSSVGFAVLYVVESLNIIRALNIDMSNLAGISESASTVWSGLSSDVKTMKAFNRANGDIVISIVNGNGPKSVNTQIFSNSSFASIAGPVSIAYGGTNTTWPLANLEFSGGRIGVIYMNLATPKLEITTYSGTLTGAAAATVSTANAERISAISIGSDSASVWFTNTANSDVQMAIVSSTPTVTTAAVSKVRGLQLLSDPIQLPTLNGAGRYAFVGRRSTNRTAFLYLEDSDSLIGARCLDEVCAIASVYQTSKIRYDSTSNIIKFATLFDLSVDGDQETGIKMLSFAFDARLNASLVDNGMVFSGGEPLFYTGSAVATGSAVYDSIEELGFHVYPTISASAVASGLLSTGTYQVIGVYEWTDASGKKHRSIPSPAVSVSVTSGQKLSVTFPTLRLTAKANVRLNIYYTVANGSIFYRDSTITLNDKTVDSVTITSAESDATLVDNEILYTQSGELERYPCPAHRYSWSHQDRLFVAGLEDPYEVRFSTRTDPIEAISFNPEFSIKIPSEYGPITGGASMGGKIIIATKNSILFVYGEGPNRLGQGSTYSEPQSIVTGIGVKEGTHHCTRVMDFGMIFQSQQGLRLLSPGLQVQRNANGVYWGAETDSLLTSNLVASALLPDKSQLRFFDGTNAIVYDYQFDQWSRFTNQACVDVAVVDGTQYRLKSNGSILYDSGNTDNGTAIALTVETGWIKLAGIQGLKRVYKIWILGTFRATSTLSVEVGYDYKDAYSEPKTVTTGDIASTTTPIELALKLPVQKCTAIRLRISESGGSGAGFALTGLMLEVGLKRGGRKLGTAKIL